MSTKDEGMNHQIKKKNGIIWIVIVIVVILCTILAVLLIWMNRKPKEWTITSYASVTGNQAMVYSIVDDRGRLILIDGGWEEDAEQVRSIIKEHGNRVYAWVITHPHPDHTGAFNVIMLEDNAILVDDIYVTNLDYERYKETAQWYDVFEACEKYYQIINQLDNVHILQENESFECLGLTFDVIHGWDSDVNHQKDHLCNNGSLAFIVSGNHEKILFLGDVQLEMEQYILARHSEELHELRYVQAGHHGNWGLTTKFYDTIDAPQEIFFDSTDALLEPGEAGYNAGELKAYFEGRGATVVNYSSAPNSILLK